MPQFSHLRSDSPLNFNLFRWLSTGAFELPFSGASPRNRAVSSPSLIGDRVSRVPYCALQVAGPYSNFAPGGNGGCDCLDPGRKYVSAYCRSLECDRPACQSIWVLARTTNHQSPKLLYLAEQSRPSVEHSRTSLRTNMSFTQPTLTASVWVNPSAVCGLADANLMSSLGLQLFAQMADCLESLDHSSARHSHGLVLRLLPIRPAASVLCDVEICPLHSVTKPNAVAYGGICSRNQQLKVTYTRRTSWSKVEEH